jgi:hypothetical protein
MAWYDTHQAAVDPDNPAANEQITFDEWNAMVTYLKDKIIDKAVNDAAIGNDKILVYKTATSTFVFEAQSTVGAINDLSDVTISGVPADNAAEAGLATVAGLAAYYPLTGATMTGNMDMGDHQISGLKLLKAYDSGGVALYDNAGTTMAFFGGSHAFSVHGDMSMVTNQIKYLGDPTSAQDASTKNYDDTHLFTKEAVTTFTDGYVPVYRTASGKFEMEAGGGSAGLPVADTTSIVKGSADGTKLLRFEVDGFTSGITRVVTFPDKNFIVGDAQESEVLLLDGTQAMTADLDFGYGLGNDIQNIEAIYSGTLNSVLSMHAGPATVAGAAIALYEKDHAADAGQIHFAVPDTTKTSHVNAIEIQGCTDTPTVNIMHGLDMNVKDIDDIGALILNDATELTIDAAGQVTATQSFHTIDTYGDGATDDLDSIAGSTPGQILVIQAADSARTVVAKNGVENLILEGDMTLDNVNDTLTMIFTGVSWFELSRSNNGA